MQTNHAAPLGLREKLGYGLGDIASNFYLQFFGIFLLYYYTDVYGIEPAAVATMLLVTKIIDAVSDPVMGLIADRTRSRWGRYRGYLLWAAIPYGLCGYAMFIGPELSPTGKLIYAYVTYSLVMLAFTAINVPYSALMGVISPASIERTKVTTYRFFCASFASLLISSLVTPLKNYLGGGDEATGFRLTMALFAVLSVLLFWTTFATTRERIQPLPQSSTVRDDLASLLRNYSWIILVIGGILMLSGLVTRMSSALYYLKYNVGDDGSRVFLVFDSTSLFLAIGTIGQILGVLATQMLVIRFDKHHLMIVLALLYAVSMLLSYMIPPTSMSLIIAVHAFSMSMFGPIIVLLFAMYTDCAEYGEWKTGQQTTGLVVSASMFSLKFGGAFGAAIPGYVLSLFGFVANAAQSEHTLTGIRLVFTVIPAVCFTSAAALFAFYRLDRARLMQVEQDLSFRRQADAAR